ncbi:hypothetical protein L6452_05480 [Arctium lappa]|uniref:Uncharacterized protein n=1 Tax=Arctium lappa TaxID=4217 RepID=A0ACB9EGQ4_ARCLA|nr:hypothetical protein L6452_05480 [Arctium lappa]
MFLQAHLDPSLSRLISSPPASHQKDLPVEEETERKRLEQAGDAIFPESPDWTKTKKRKNIIENAGDRVKVKIECLIQFSKKEVGKQLDECKRKACYASKMEFICYVLPCFSLTVAARGEAILSDTIGINEVLLVHTSVVRADMGFSQLPTQLLVASTGSVTTCFYCELGRACRKLRSIAIGLSVPDGFK